MKSLSRFIKPFAKTHQPDLAQPTQTEQSVSESAKIQPVQLLNESTKSFILQRYSQKDFSEFDYATVRDFCDSADNLPQICYLNGDLKNVQRAWTLKAILGQVPVGSRLLEIGAGLPLVAGMLVELGYQVTVVDPYEGAGNGPVEYETYVQQFPHVNVIKAQFDDQLSGFSEGSFDCIYSISVLEHIPPEGLEAVYRGIKKFLRPQGSSIHCIDNVIQGAGTELHENMVKLILHQQKQLKDSSYSLEHASREYDQTLSQLKEDLETFYLSPTGHHLWRCGLSYDEFPFRKVVSMQTCVVKTAIASVQVGEAAANQV